jgi:hypothetical protein
VPKHSRIAGALQRFGRRFGDTALAEVVQQAFIGLIQRIKQDHADRNLTLRDGIRVERGALIMDLHLWNEHLPPFPSEAADFDWTSYVEKQIQKPIPGSLSGA